MSVIVAGHCDTLLPSDCFCPLYEVTTCMPYPSLALQPGSWAAEQRLGSALDRYIEKVFLQYSLLFTFLKLRSCSYLSFHSNQEISFTHESEALVGLVAGQAVPNSQ